MQTWCKVIGKTKACSPHPLFWQFEMCCNKGITLEKCALKQQTCLGQNILFLVFHLLADFLKMQIYQINIIPFRSHKPSNRLIDLPIAILCLFCYFPCIFCNASRYVFKSNLNSLRKKPIVGYEKKGFMSLEMSTIKNT